MIGDEGLMEACVVVGDTAIEVAKEIALSMVRWKMEKEDQVEDRVTVNDDDGGV